MKIHMFLRRIFSEIGMSYVQERKLIGDKSLESYGFKMEIEIQKNFMFQLNKRELTIQYFRSKMLFQVILLLMKILFGMKG